MILMIDEDSNQSQSNNYKNLYESLLKQHNVLKSEFNKQSDELLSMKNSEVDFQTINESLRSNMKILQKNFNVQKLLLHDTQKILTKQFKAASQHKNYTFKKEIKTYLSTIFTQNQLDL